MIQIQFHFTSFSRFNVFKMHFSGGENDASADMSTPEAEIDELVAALYGLDADEKKLIGIG